MRPPRQSDGPTLGRPEGLSIVFTGALEAAVTIAVFGWALKSSGLTDGRATPISASSFLRTGDNTKALLGNEEPTHPNGRRRGIRGVNTGSA
jgi:hypothetical protein